MISAEQFSLAHLILSFEWFNMSDEKSARFTKIVEKYPTYRDDQINWCWKWLAGRRKDDNAEGLWRVHDKLYDLTDFIDKHPGGRDWLTITKVSGLSRREMSNISSILLQYREWT